MRSKFEWPAAHQPLIYVNCYHVLTSGKKNQGQPVCDQIQTVVIHIWGVIWHTFTTGKTQWKASKNFLRSSYWDCFLQSALFQSICTCPLSRPLQWHWTRRYRKWLFRCQAFLSVSRSDNFCMDRYWTALAAGLRCMQGSAYIFLLHYGVFSPHLSICWLY